MRIYYLGSVYDVATEDELRTLIAILTEQAA